MLKNLINKFGIYAMLSAFVILFSSCDDSTSVNEGNSALKKDIFKGWKINRTCVVQNDLGIDYYDTDHFHKIGETDVVNMGFYKIDSLENMIEVIYYKEPTTLFTTAAWVSSKSSSVPHWVIFYQRKTWGTKNFIDWEIELTGINPLKGIWTDLMYDSINAEPKVLRKFELFGEEYKSFPKLINKKVGQ